MMEVVFSYENFEYKRPVPVRGKTLAHNQFLKVTILKEEYFISVLPSFHEATLQEMAFKIKTFFTDYKLDFSKIDLTKRFFNLVAEDSFLKNIQAEMLFNIESVLLGIISKTHPHLIERAPVLINELYRTENALVTYINTECLKIKITPGHAKKTLQLLRELHALNPSMIFRLDGNRQFELEELVELYHVLEEGLTPASFALIDYFEEPLKNFYDTFLFQKRSKINIAIDESFQFLKDSNKLFSPIVIKPSLIGISPALSLLRSRQDLRFIISSSFEHPTIMSGLYFLAQERPSEFHGLENFIK